MDPKPYIVQRIYSPPVELSKVSEHATPEEAQAEAERLHQESEAGGDHTTRFEGIRNPDVTDHVTTPAGVVTDV